VQKAPVAHIDRPWWGVDAKTKKWNEAWKIEALIEDMAKKFGGTFVGT
jgi:hypothetical protein